MTVILRISARIKPDKMRRVWYNICIIHTLHKKCQMCGRNWDDAASAFCLPIIQTSSFFLPPSHQMFQYFQTKRYHVVTTIQIMLSMEQNNKTPPWCDHHIDYAFNGTKHQKNQLHIKNATLAEGFLSQQR